MPFSLGVKTPGLVYSIVKMHMRDFFPGTKPPPFTAQVSETNFKLAVHWQDLLSHPERMETSFLSEKFDGARLAYSLPFQICAILLQSSPPALKKQGKENKKLGTPSS